MFCRTCGHEVGADKRFCGNCGTEVAHLGQNDLPAQKKSTRKVSRFLWIGGCVVLIAIIIFAVLTDAHSSSSLSGGGNGLSLANEEAVVDINCDNGSGGSGTIMTADGTVVTNNHVISGATSCEVTIPDPATGQIDEIYEATPVIIPKLSKQYDVALLKIDASYTDSGGKTWGSYPRSFTPFALPSSCDNSQESKLGDSVRIYGYPVTSGGYNLTITDGIISSFSDDGYVLTSAKVDSGNSGGLAIDQDGCWLGIPSAVTSGNYQNLGVIIPSSIVDANFVNSVESKPSPLGIKTTNNAMESEVAATPQLANDQRCQNNYGDFSQWSGENDASGNPTCGCKSGYTWSFSGDSCVSRSSLQSRCQSNYGNGSYSYLQGGKSVCGCSAGYTWNADQTACTQPQITKTGYQICSEQGANETWGGSYGTNGSFQCVCVSGTHWNGTACVNTTTADGNQTCSSRFPNEVWDGTYNSQGGFNCVCQSGYFYDSSTQGCVVGQQYCQNREGIGANYIASTNQCSCESGYIFNGTQCQLGNLYCMQHWGAGAHFDESTQKCSY